MRHIPAALLLALPEILTAQREPPLAIAGVSVVDVVQGRLVANQTVVIENRRITALGPRASVRTPAGARVINGRGRFLMPGLWDMHVHSPGPDNDALLPVYVAYGVTGVRDMGADLELLLAQRARIARGDAVGPRIVMAGPILDGPLGFPMPQAHRRWRVELTDTTRARYVVDSIAALGADFIKVHERLAPDVYRAIANQARGQRLPIAGHAPTAVGPRAAALVGQRSIEHLVNVPFTCTGEEARTLRPRSGLERLFGGCATDNADVTLRQFVQSGTWHTPTLVVQQRIVVGPDAIRDDPGMRHVPPSVRALLREVGPLDLPAPRADVRTRLNRLLAKRVEQVGQMHRARVRLLVGTDAPGVAPGWSVHEEMRLLVTAGLSPMDAIRAATLSPARYLGASDSLGAVATGRVADLVLLDANPLTDIRNSRRIRAVIANGRVFDRAALDGLLPR
jgi:imidazolonepropionase-like amidohydrolase